MKKLSSIFLAFMLVFTISFGTLTQNVDAAASTNKSTVKKANVKSTLKGEITIAAAASLKGSLEEIKKTFIAQNKGVKININYGGSGALQTQIEQGAPIDLFLSADDNNVINLQKNKKGSLIVDKSKKNILSNKVVLIVNSKYKDKINSLEDLKKLKNEKIAVGTPASVPVGKYTKQSLEKLGIFKSIENKIVYAKDVSTVLTYVEKEEAVAGFVYSTDAKTAKNSVVKLELPANSYEKVIYSGAVIKDSKNKVVAQAFFDYITQVKAQEVFKKYGFTGVK